MRVSAHGKLAFFMMLLSRVNEMAQKHPDPSVVPVQLVPHFSGEALVFGDEATGTVSVSHYSLGVGEKVTLDARGVHHIYEFQPSERAERGPEIAHRIVSLLRS